MRAYTIHGSSIANSFGSVETVLLLLVFSLLAACGLVDNNLSRHEYFAPMVGGDLTLQRKAYLCESTLSRPWPDTRTDSLVHLVQYLDNCSFIYKGTIIDELDIGTPLRLHRVYEPTGLNASGVTAVGEISGHEFEYDWGGRLMPINLAPWEEGPLDPNRCLGTIWDECKPTSDIQPGSKRN